MYDGHTQRSSNGLAVAAIALLTIMIVTGLALWVVAGKTSDPHGQPHATTSLQVPTSSLLQVLSDDLGPTATQADLEAAVKDWLTEQQSVTVRFASTAASG